MSWKCDFDGFLSLQSFADILERLKWMLVGPLKIIRSCTKLCTNTTWGRKPHNADASMSLWDQSSCFSLSVNPSVSTFTKVAKRETWFNSRQTRKLTRSHNYRKGSSLYNGTNVKITTPLYHPLVDVMRLFSHDWTIFWCRQINHDSLLHFCDITEENWSRTARGSTN